MPVVFLHLVNPAFTNKWYVANHARRGKAWQVTHDVVLQLLHFMNRKSPVFRVGDHVALVEVVRHDLAVIQQHEAQIQ